jgi:hypothetical protein
MTALSRGSARKWHDEPKSGTMNGESGTMKKRKIAKKAVKVRITVIMPSIGN